MHSLDLTMIDSSILHWTQTAAWCHWSPLHISSHSHWAGCYTTAWSMGQKLPFFTQIPALTMGLPLPQCYSHYWYRSSFTSRSRELLASADHPSTGRHLASYMALPLCTFQGDTGCPTIYMQGLWACSAYIPPILPLLWPPACSCRPRDTSVLCYIPGQCPQAPSTGLLLVTYMGCRHYTLTWACQTHSKVPSSCINVSGPYMFSLTQSFTSWPSHMTCWYWPSPYTSFLHSKSCRLPWPWLILDSFRQVNSQEIRNASTQHATCASRTCCITLQPSQHYNALLSIWNSARHTPSDKASTWSLAALAPNSEVPVPRGMLYRPIRQTGPPQQHPSSNYMANHSPGLLWWAT